ncbi:MAG: DUF928 domain-containing protein [Tildeniella nuda ZEHNDER 1965/U140]|jgi:hypothetical protein|nr:DUF928 domain-containing protein [Tildeniella nuda ZEHNDER 1965/U140]
MLGTKRWRYHTLLSLTLLVPSVLVTELPAATQTAVPRPAIASPIKVSLKFKVPKRGAPRSTAGGASRGSCLRGSQQPTNKLLTAVVPNTRLGFTFAERPSFFVYIPQSSAQTAAFLLLSDDDTKVVYETTFALPATAGIVRFDLPDSAPALQVGKQYHWFMTTLCDATTGLSGSPTVEGWIERSNPDVALTKALQKTLPGNRPNLYAEAGIWHETLTELADLQQKYPQNSRFLNDWRDVVRSVGLEAIAAAPLVTANTEKP